MLALRWLKLPHERSDRTLLLVDLQLGVEVESSNDDVAGEIDGADNVEHEGIIEGNALRHLHHTQDDDQVGAIANVSILFFAPPDICATSCRVEKDLHLRRESHLD
jgi:hypothetical protein